MQLEIMNYREEPAARLIEGYTFIVSTEFAVFCTTDESQMRVAYNLM